MEGFPDTWQGLEYTPIVKDLLFPLWRSRFLEFPQSPLGVEVCLVYHFLRKSTPRRTR